MANIQIKIKNMREIKSAFNKAPEIMKISLSRAIPLALKAIEQDEEAEYASLGIGVRSGRLLLSIRTGIFYQTGSLRGEVGPNVTNSAGLDVTSNSWHGINHYSVFVHEGTKFTRARPFLANAVKDAQPEVDRLFQVAVQDTLNAIARKT